MMTTNQSIDQFHEIMTRKVAEANELVQVAQKNLNRAKAELENAVIVYETTLTLVEELKPFVPVRIASD